MWLYREIIIFVYVKTLQSITFLNWKGIYLLCTTLATIIQTQVSSIENVAHLAFSMYVQSILNTFGSPVLNAYIFVFCTL